MVPEVLTELLVLRAQAGFADAVNLLARTWHNRLWQYARRLTGRDDAASDVVQDAWIAIIRGLHGLEDPARFAGWAYRIVTRTIAQWIRKRQRRREVETNLQSRAVAVENFENATDDVDEVRTALRKLPTEQQAILHLRYVDDLGIDEIAHAVNVPAGTVKSRLFHARKQLRDIIERTRT